MDSFDRRRSLFPYVAGALLLVLFLVRGLGGGGDGAEAQSVTLDGPGAGAAAAGRAGKTPSRDRVWVHVAGAVRRPGLYRVDAGSRAGTAVDAAGGLARRADLEAINLAATVRDGQQVIVPARGQRPPVAAPASDAAAPGSSPGPGGGAKITLATATAEQLDSLDGIGPTLARRIIQWRDAHGGFQSIEQLREVEGIGDKRFQALRAAVAP
jgi:competence protein ComEA